MTQEGITAKSQTENNRDTKLIPNVLSQKHHRIIWLIESVWAGRGFGVYRGDIEYNTI